MSFQSPLLLLALAILPLLAALYVFNQRRRRAYAVRFTNLALLSQVMGKGPGVRRHLPAVLFGLGTLGLLLAMARPTAAISIPRDRASVMLAVDVSGSMAASDVQPSRIEAARAAARTLIDRLPGQAQVGLVSFNGQANVISPPTTDHQAVESALEGLRPGGGTAIGDGLQLAVQQLVQTATPDQSGKRPPTMIVLLTDGASNTGIPPADAAAQAKAAGIPVETVGIGVRGQTTFLGGRMIDGVDEQALQSISAATGGHYFYAAESGALQDVYGQLGSTFGWKIEKVDLTIPVLAAGTLIVVAGGLLSLRWFRLLP
ncbi:MAG: VWA domain-containing protein [Candidatus Dormibacteraeota bacterium]|nr:VWA domain-containing protein [Candidatus Dormibacteraeota bacterium]